MEKKKLLFTVVSLLQLGVMQVNAAPETDAKAEAARISREVDMIMRAHQMMEKQAKRDPELRARLDRQQKKLDAEFEARQAALQKKRESVRTDAKKAAKPEAYKGAFQDKKDIQALVKKTQTPLKNALVHEKDAIGKCKKSTLRPEEIQKRLQELQQKKDVQNQENLYVFVSFSMPKNSLQQLLNCAQNYNAKIVVRGLLNNSFQETAAFMKELGSDSNRLEMNPELFKQHNIQVVPTFVLVKQETRRLQGDVSLEFAHKTLHAKD